MKNSTFAQRLIQAMEDADISAAELCRRCSISKSTMSQYRSGQYEAKRDRILQLARVLGCSADWLAGEDVPMNTVSGDCSASGAVPVLGMVTLRDDSLFAPENIIGHELAEEIYCDGHHFVMTASGDSMEPVICAGDRLLCVRQDTLEDGQMGIFLLPDGDTMVRRLEIQNGTSVLTSFNCYYPPRSIEAFGGVQIIGRVIRSSRYW